MLSGVFIPFKETGVGAVEASIPEFTFFTILIREGRRENINKVIGKHIVMYFFGLGLRL